MQEYFVINIIKGLSEVNKYADSIIAVIKKAYDTVTEIY